MHRLWAGGVATALLLGLAATTSAQPKPTFGKGDGLIGGLFADHKPAVPAPDKSNDNGSTSPSGAAKPAPSPAVARATLDREEKVLLRRQAVCDQLRQIALDTGNTEMEQQVEQLNQQAFTIFQQRTAGLADIAAEEKHAHPAAGRTLPLTQGTGASRPAREDQ
jgi:hypothetical protein